MLERIKQFVLAQALRCQVLELVLILGLVELQTEFHLCRQLEQQIIQLLEQVLTDVSELTLLP